MKLKPHRTKHAIGLSSLYSMPDFHSHRLSIPRTVTRSFDFDEYWKYTTDRHEQNEESRLMQSWNRYRRDHPKACGGALTPVPVRPFAFLDLPIDLRKQVLGMLLSYDVRIRQLEFGQPNFDAWEPIDVRIFAMSRQVHAATFYEENTFLAECRDFWHRYRLPLFVRESSGVSPPRPAERMQRVHVEVGLGKKVESVGAAATGTALQRPNKL